MHVCSEMLRSHVLRSVLAIAIAIGSVRSCDRARALRPGGDTTNGNQLQLWDCNGKKSQQWGYDAQMQTIYLAASLNQDATKCIDLRNGGSGDGVPVQIYDCVG